MFHQFYKGKRVLLTGHTGFKGSWLSLWLTKLGAEVYGYSLEPLTSDDNFVQCKLEGLLNHRVGDVRNPEDLSAYFREVKPHVAFHLAAQPLVLESHRDPRTTFETNVMGTVNFFEAVRQSDSVRVAINVTSDKCYDNKEWVWGYKETDPLGGHDPYSASKGCSEIVTASYISSFLNKQCLVASVRAGNVIGGGDWSENRIVPDFFKAIRRNEKLKIRNPLSIRPWQHVLEPLSGYLWLASRMEKEQLGGSSWNFGPSMDNHATVGTLINSIIANCKRGGFEVQALDNPPHEAHYLKLDISKAISVLDWRPALEFSKTIEFTVKGYIDQLEGKDLKDCRLDQIDQYTSTAKAADIAWAQQ
jgi:CDP-glucose 4,6-dehydratase